MYQVLIVDDEEIIKIGLRSIINWEQYGFNIVGTAENGQQALDTAKKIRPDVIITDLYMPIMDGFELIERLKKNGLECEIIVLSNYGDIENVKKAIKMGAEDYILKVSYDQKKFAVLLESLSEKLSRKKQVGKIKAQNEPKEEISLSQMKEYLLG
ncbi:MAG: response regulator, partial [Hungatella sp.]